MSIGDQCPTCGQIHAGSACPPIVIPCDSIFNFPPKDWQHQSPPGGVIFPHPSPTYIVVPNAELERRLAALESLAASHWTAKSYTCSPLEPVKIPGYERTGATTTLDKIRPGPFIHFHQDGPHLGFKSEYHDNYGIIAYNEAGERYHGKGDVREIEVDLSVEKKPSGTLSRTIRVICERLRAGEDRSSVERDYGLDEGDLKMLGPEEYLTSIKFDEAEESLSDLREQHAETVKERDDARLRVKALEDQMQATIAEFERKIEARNREIATLKGLVGEMKERLK